jgi:hypothetical protein
MPDQDPKSDQEKIIPDPGPGSPGPGMKMKQNFSDKIHNIST